MNELSNKKPLVLIVDDIPKNLQVLSNILHSEGFQISFASNGRQALSVVETTLPDLILLDIMMPEMDGFKVCELLKKDPKTKNIPIIFLTGKVETDDIVKGFELGAVDYITKPFNAVELLSRVRTHIDLKLSKDSLIIYNQKLEDYQKELKRVIAAKDKFFSIIAHDLRGPFSGFLGLSELLVDEFDALDKDEIVDIGISMNKAAKRLFEFLENLLEWSRSQMGHIDYKPANISVNALFDRNISLIQVNAEQKDISLVNKLQEDCYIYADNYMLNTIMRNLLSNAVKFTHAGGQIEIDAKQTDDGFVEISVADNGIGMSEEAKNKIFSIESKYTTPGTAKESGTGLGLILCKELTEKNGGSIYVESQSGKGTVFFVKIPKAKSDINDILIA